MKTGFYLAMLALTAGAFMPLPGRIGARGGFARKFPNRRHRLSPSRIDRARAFSRRHMLVIGIVQLLPTMIAAQLVTLSHLERRTQLNGAVSWVLAAYFVCVGPCLVQFFQHLRKP